jgi:GTP:adenosylcobinamide-phosphate guanylyltransferase
MKKLTLIFPMAGQGARFGYRFKPFLDLHGRTFIEEAFDPFRGWLLQIGKTHFIFTREQDGAHAVRERLSQMFAGVRHDAAVLDAPTAGPAQTLVHCLSMKNVTGPILVCDCDHAVDVDSLMRATQDPRVECAVPTWDIANEPLSAWSVASIGHDGRIGAVAEKALPETGDCFRGVIGCYYFSDAERVRALVAGGNLLYLSDVISRYLQEGRAVYSIPIERARFFGDPARLAQTVGGVDAAAR